MQDILAEIVGRTKNSDNIMGVNASDEDSTAKDTIHVGGVPTPPPDEDEDEQPLIKTSKRKIKEVSEDMNEKPAKKSKSSSASTPKVLMDDIPTSEHHDPATETKEPTPEAFNENLQRMWDDGQIDGGFGPNTAFGSVPVPHPPPASSGYGFGMGTYNNFEDDEDPVFISSEGYVRRTRYPYAHMDLRTGQQWYQPWLPRSLRRRPYPGFPNQL